MTYRERRQAKADRLEEWASKRESKAETHQKAAADYIERVPLGQPILVGHHSEGRARRDQAKFNGDMAKTFEHSDKAEEMRSRAANIRSAANNAIYSDDPDVVERLEEKIAKLENERLEAKRLNVEFKASHKTELAGMTAYLRNQAMPYPSFSLTNLSGNINRAKKRLAVLKARAAS